MKYSIYFNKGKMRSNNEDNYFLDLNSRPYQVVAVADGMGGHNAGEVASKIAINSVKEYKFGGQADLQQEIKYVINSANQEIILTGQGNSEYKDMGTTLTLGIINNNQLYFGHIGDSRIYLYRDNNLDLLTTDDSLVNKLLKQNKINDEEAFNHPQKNILTQALGLDDKLKIETGVITLQENDILLFCTDGLSDMIKFNEIQNVLEDNAPEVNTITDKLGKMAMANGGTDNITLIVLNYN